MDSRRSKYPVMLLLRALGPGGTERQAVTLAKGLKDRGWPVSVACFYGSGHFKSELVRSDVPLFALGKRGRWDIVSLCWRLSQLLSEVRPRVVYSFLPVPNVIAGLVGSLFPDLAVIWGVRSSNVRFSEYDWTRRATFWLERRVVRLADVIVCNSESGYANRLRGGFPRSSTRVIPNGIDIRCIRYDRCARRRTRRDWKVPRSAIVVGLVGRLDPMKGHAVFLEVADRLTRQREDWYFVWLGTGSAEYRRSLLDQRQCLQASGHCIVLDTSVTMQGFYSGLDMLVSASLYGEGFSNVLAEAMACGRPCVATDVGDASQIVDGLGVVVPPADVEALERGIVNLRERLEAEGDELRTLVTQSVVNRFSADRMVEETASVIVAAVEGHH